MDPIDYNNPNNNWMQTGYDPYHGMNDVDRMTAGCLQGVAVIVAIILGLLMCALLSGCTTTKYVTVPEYHTDTLRLSRNIRDSIYVHDSTYVREKGDTVTIERWHTRYVERTRTDTIYQSKRDSIPYPVDVTKEVPAPLTWWQQARLHLANVVLYLLLLILLWKIYKMWLTDR